MATRMLQRRGTAAEWAAVNPILADGEIGFERDTRVFKIGDGVTAWNALKHDYVRQVGGDTITAAAPTTIPLVVKGAVGQTAHLLEAQDNTGKSLVRIRSGGSVAIGGDPSAEVGGMLTVASSAADVTAVRVRGAVGQTANLLDLQSGDGTLRSSFDSSGRLGIRMLYQSSSPASLSVEALNSDHRGLLLRASVGQVANMLEVQDSAGAVMTRITNAGRLVVESVGYFGPNAGSTVGVGSVRVLPVTTSDVGLTVRGLAAQARELIRLEDSAGSTVGIWGPDGTINLFMGNARLRFGFIGDYGTVRTFNDAAGAAGTLVGRYLAYGKDSLGNDHLYTDQRSLTETVTDGAEDGYYDIYTSTAGALKATVRFGQSIYAAHLWINKVDQRGLAIRGIASQTANFFEAQSSAGVALATISPLGALTASSAYVQGAADAGGDRILRLQEKSTDAFNYNGHGVLYVVAGALKYRAPGGKITTLALAT